MWKLKNTILNDQWFKEKIKREIRKYLEINVNKNKICQNVRDAAEEVLRGKFTVINTTLRKKERSKINFMPQGIRKRKKEILMIRAEINQIEAKTQ